MAVVKLFVGSSCPPCAEIKSRVEAGQVEAGGAEIRMVDVETDEGFNEFVKDVIGQNDGELPSAYQDGHQCGLALDDEKGIVVIDCPSTPPSSPAPA